jgi:hypothetical protein
MGETSGSPVNAHEVNRSLALAARLLLLLAVRVVSLALDPASAFAGFVCAVSAVSVLCGSCCAVSAVATLCRVSPVACAAVLVLFAVCVCCACVTVAVLSPC